ncbi:MAG: tRNA dimethylallyltransferase [Rickettsiales bacterium]|jgi:tRNA dimethylallyltransferase
MEYECGPNAKIIVISGATAIGKSALATKIACQKDGVIINADAIQLYQELPILSAQPNAEDSKSAPHFLYSALKHNQNSSLAIWLDLARKQIDLALKGGKLPIVVGGTGLYLSKLIDGINTIPKTDEDLERSIRKIEDREELIQDLRNLGDNLENLENLDKQRLARRLGVLKQTGKNLSWWQNRPNEIFYPKEYFHHINVNLPREELYQNCDSRFDLMLKSGAIEEVQNLLKEDLKEDATIQKTIGFLEIKSFLNGEINIDEAKIIASQKTRNYAKRQLTWFRNQFRE